MWPFYLNRCLVFYDRMCDSHGARVQVMTSDNHVQVLYTKATLFSLSFAIFRDLFNTRKTNICKTKKQTNKKKKKKKHEILITNYWCVKLLFYLIIQAFLNLTCGIVKRFCLISYKFPTLFLRQNSKKLRNLIHSDSASQNREI